VLSMSAMSSGQAIYYVGLATEDYFLQEAEPKGIWVGEGAEKLGLLGEVQPNHLYNLFKGLSPDGGRALIQFQRHKGKATHRPGWDLTLSSPKSVSVLFAQSDAGTRRIIECAHFSAVKETLAYLEREAGQTRRGKAGKRIESAKLVIATFEHSSSRELDPQLHTHCLCLNIAVRLDGTTGSLSSLSLFKSKMAAGALYRLSLARGLSKNLGLSIGEDGASFKVEGVPEGVCRFFSKRRQAIENEIRKDGIVSAAGAAMAAIKTRRRKECVSREELFSVWQKQGSELGFGPLEARSLLGRHRQFSPDIESVKREAAVSLMLTGQTFTKEDAIRETSKAGITKNLMVKDAIEAAGFIVRNAGKHGKSRYSLKVGEHEDELFSRIEQLNRAMGPSVSHRHLEEEIARAGLTKEQESALKHLTEETGSFAILRGIAGSGKTHILGAAAKVWEKSGYKVKGICLSGLAAKELSLKGGIESETFAKAFWEQSKSPMAVRWNNEKKRFYFDFSGCRFKIDAKTIVLVDEAASANIACLSQIAKICFEKGAKLVFAGDPMLPQYSYSPFSKLVERFKAANLSVPLRQKEEWTKQASKDFAQGDCDKALSAFKEKGLLHDEGDPKRELIDKWLKSSVSAKYKVILTSNSDSAKELNAMAQEANRPNLGLAWVIVKGQKFYMGERVAFTKTSKSKGIASGDLGTVTAINPIPGFRSVEVKLDSGERIRVDLELLPDLLVLGYASDKSQGRQTKEAYILLDHSNSRLAYLQVTRAEKTEFFVDQESARFPERNRDRGLYFGL
jgi:conjugative relaxase-like TrwC/TraI family protein